MQATGEYNVRLDWGKRTAGASVDAFGQKSDTFASQGSVWGKIEQRTGGRASAKESEHQTQTARIRIRQYPGIVAGDRLTDQGYGDVWTVESVTRDVNEIVCEVTRPRFTTGGGTAS